MFNLKTGLRSRHGNARAPTNVVGKPRLQLIVVRQHLSSGFEHEVDPSVFLIRSETQIAVSFKHAAMATVFIGIPRRPAEHLAEPDRDILRMVGTERREHRCQEGIGFYLFVKARCQGFERGGAARDLKDARSVHRNGYSAVTPYDPCPSRLKI